MFRKFMLLHQLLSVGHLSVRSSLQWINKMYCSLPKAARSGVAYVSWSGVAYVSWSSVAYVSWSVVAGFGEISKALA